MSSAKGTALITGASSGIGAIYADRLARRGYDLVLVARNLSRLEKVAAQLRVEAGRTVAVLAADLSEKSGLARVEHLFRPGTHISMIVNNAGIGGVAPLLNSVVGDMENLITLNVTALMRLTYAAVPAFIARGGGTIINIGSTVAIAPEVLNGVYGGSKAFVVAFSRSLQHELADKGIKVQLVLPGATATQFWSIAGMPVEHLPSEIVMQPEDVVDAALVGLDRGEFVTVPSLPDIADLEAYEAARQKLLPNLSRSEPAARYQLA